MKTYLSILLLLVLNACGQKEESVPVSPPPVAYEFGSGSLGDAPAGNAELPTLSSVSEHGAKALPVTPPAETPRFELKTAEKVQEAPKVEVDRTNVFVTEGGSAADNPLSKPRRDGVVALRATPSGSLAEKLQKTSAGKRIVWMPASRADGEFLGLPWLTAAALSSDGTVLAVIERTGADGGPYGSRLVLINTSALNVMQVLELNASIAELQISSDRESVFALCREQKKLNQMLRIAEFDLRTGTEKQSLKLENPDEKFLLAENANLLFRLNAPGQTLFAYPLDALAPAHGRSVTADVSNSIMSYSSNDKTLVLFSPGLMVHYAVSDLSAFQTRKLSLNSLSSVFNMGSRDRWVITDNNGKAYYINNSFISPMTEQAGRFVFRDPSKNEIYLEKRLQNALGIFRQSPLTYIEEIQPLRLWPRSSASTFFTGFLPDGGRLIWVDRAGLFCILAKPPRGGIWAKIPFIEPQK